MIEEINLLQGDQPPVEVKPPERITQLEYMPKSVKGRHLEDGIELNNPTITNSYKFSVYRSAALNTPNNAQAVLIFDTENYDDLENYSTSTGLYTAPVSGFYLLTARISHQANIRTILSFLVNGTEVIRGEDRVGTGGNLTMSANGLVQLSQGDTMGVYVYTASATAYLVAGVPKALNSFEGFLVSQV